MSNKSPVVKKRRTSGAAASSAAVATEIESVAHLHSLEPRALVSVKGILVQMPEAVRHVSVRSKGDCMERKAVLDFVVADKSSATQVSFWGPLVDRYYGALQDAFDAGAEGALPQVHLTNVEIVSPKDKVLRPYRKLQSTSRTELTIEKAQILHHQPAAHQTIANFRDILVTTAPWVGTLVGTIVEVGECREAVRSGEPIQEIKVVDAHNNGLTLIAYAGATSDPSLAVQKRVAFYFVQAKAGEGSRSGSVWIFADAWLCELEEVEEVPSIKQMVDLK
ncbi:unnamed protein product [Symbiodinium sp. CCMP2592]|nr:unnamed protein product [Symbiodinium sp. CCMP2592]